MSISWVLCTCLIFFVRFYEYGLFPTVAIINTARLWGVHFLMSPMQQLCHWTTLWCHTELMVARNDSLMPFLVWGSPSINVHKECKNMQTSQSEMHAKTAASFKTWYQMISDREMRWRYEMLYDFWFLHIPADAWRLREYPHFIIRWSVMAPVALNSWALWSKWNNATTACRFQPDNQRTHVTHDSCLQVFGC